MKMINPILVVVVGLLISLASCSNDHSHDVSSPNKQYILASDLALRAALADPRPDSANCMLVQMLYSTSASSSEQLGGATAFSVSCCCPCTSLVSTTSTSQISVKSPRDSTHCPCPSLMQWNVVAPGESVKSISIDELPFDSHPAPPSDSLINATVFELAHERTLPDGPHVLRISADFTGTGMQDYALEIVTRNGKPYLKN